MFLAALQVSTAPTTGKHLTQALKSYPHASPCRLARQEGRD
jgi:hypothetical protein